MANGDTHYIISDHICPACKEKIEDLELNLKEQVKANSELKNLLLGAMGSDIGNVVENLANDKLSLDRQLSAVKTQIEKETDNVDTLTAQADTWRSKYLALKIALRECTAWKTNAIKVIDEAASILKDLLADQDRLWASAASTYSSLATLCKQTKSAEDICYIPLRPPHCSVVHVGEINQKFARCILTCYAKENVSNAILHENQPSAEPTSACKRAANLLRSLTTLSYVQGSPKGSGSNDRDTLIERFHPTTKLDSDGPIVCRGCKGHVTIL